MALSKKKKFDIERIRRIIEDDRYISNSRISEIEIQKIYNDYATGYYSGNLEKTKNEILDLLNRNLPAKVHSVRGRVKDPDHLIEKIYRKSAKDEEKYGSICEDNYNKLITDLIGIRIIILNKKEWREVHDCLLELFHNDPDKYIKNSKDLILNYDKYDSADEDIEPTIYHVEKPVVYALSDDDRSIYSDRYLDINLSKKSYRSIHYIIRYKDVYFEIQVRTLFEEGWLEFDHRIKYPYDDGNSKKNEFASILSSLAQTADKLISFYDEKDFKKASPKKLDVVNQAENKNNDVNNSSFRSKITNLF